MMGLATRQKKKNNKKSLRAFHESVCAPKLAAVVRTDLCKVPGSGIWKVTPQRCHSLFLWVGKSRVRSKSCFPVTRTHMPLSPSNMLVSPPFLILISKLYHHLTLICSFLEAVYHINGSVYCWEYFPCTMICNLLISTSCILLVHIQFNL